MAGYLEVICGGMYSGKSSEMIRRIKRAQYAQKRVQLFKPAMDGRYHSTQVVAHDRRNHDALAIVDVDEILTQLEPDTDIVAIDEVQFFAEDRTVEVVKELMARDIKVIVAGLDMDFTGRPFGAVPVLMAIADKVDKLKAICIRCGEEAYISQRLVDGKPASVTDPQIKVGGTESYEARCRRCWQLSP